MAQRMSTTDLAPDSVTAYLEEIGRTPLLTAAEEIELGRTIDAGREAAERLATATSALERRRLQRLVEEGQRARDHFVQANLRLVVSIANRYRTGLTAIDLVDLFQEGNIGLIRAVEKFDWRKGFKFSSYATWWIRQAIQRALLEKGRPLRVSSRIHDAAITVNRIDGELQAELGRRPSVAELADRSGVAADVVREVHSVANVTSLEHPIGEDGAVIGDFIELDDAEGPEDVAVRVDGSAALQRAIARLGEREQLILRRRYGFHDEVPRTLAEIGELLQLTPERVHQLEKAALCRLRHPSFGLREKDLM